MAAAAGSAARGGSIPGAKAAGHGLRSPGKPVALADITNTGRPNPPGSVHAVADVLKENAKLSHLLAERTKVIEVSRVEMQKIRLALHAMQQKNLQLVQANSQMFAEINQGKDRIKLLQHELACTIAVLKGKDSDLKRISKTANHQQNEAKILKKARPSKCAAAEAHQKAAGAIVQHLVEVQSVPSYTNCQEPPQDKTAKRCTNRQKSEPCEVKKDTNTVQHSCRPHMQSSGSLHDDDPRKTLRRRSARLNPGSFEVTEVFCETLHEDSTVPSAPTSNVPKQQEPNAGKYMRKSLQNKPQCDAIAQEVEAPELKKKQRSKHAHKEVCLVEEIQEAGSTVAGVEAHKFDIEDPEPRGTKRKSMRIDANKRMLESCEGRMASNKEECINTKCDSTSSMPLQHRTRRKSSRLDSGPCEVTNGTFEIVQEDTVAPYAPPSSNVLIEQTKNDMQNGCSSLTKPSEEQVIGRRSSVGRPSRRAAEKIVSYREVPLNVKMRRP